jgi:hypothetical protein
MKPILRLLTHSAVTCLVAAESYAQADVPVPDSALASLVSSGIFDSLRGGGWRPDVQWIAYDSITFRALRPVAALRGIALAAPVDSWLPCRGSTDSLRAPLAGPTAYHVRLRTTRDTTGRLLVQISVRCRFIHRRSRGLDGFEQGMDWEVTKDESGWRLLRPYSRWVT